MKIIFDDDFLDSGKIDPETVFLVLNDSFMSQTSIHAKISNIISQDCSDCKARISDHWKIMDLYNGIYCINCDDQEAKSTRL